jgi:hypothetical protein
VNADELRALQTPLKSRYRVEPDAALVTLRVPPTVSVRRQA